MEVGRTFMTITSFQYLLFLGMTLIIYYILPKSWQWIELLLFSIAFYCLATTPYTFVFVLIEMIIAYVGTWLNSKEEKVEKRRNVVVGMIFLIALLWVLLKGDAFWCAFSHYIHKVIPIVPELKPLSIMAALGMGYFTLQIIGYILDCYWGIVEPQKNPLKLLLFISFFPQLTTGPISRYEQMQGLYEKHTFSYENVSLGAQRILWGFFKKLVISERVAIIVNAIWDDPVRFGGLYLWIAILLYPLQLYTDFSGCIDIVIGTAEMFGINMPENFKNPFFSKTMQEFWQRWHITLGNWAKNYVFYPILKSRWLTQFSDYARKKVGKKKGKLFTTAIGMFCLWMFMGIWHGGVRYVVGESLFFWAILIGSEFLSKWFIKVKKTMGISEKTDSWKMFQMVRTYLLFAIGIIFFRASEFSEAIGFIREAFKVFKKEMFNPWIFFDGSMLELGVTYGDFNILIFSVLLLFIAAIVREKCGSARKWMKEQVVLFRWIVWLGLLMFVIIYGMYGPGYDAAAFIYGGF